MKKNEEVKRVNILFPNKFDADYISWIGYSQRGGLHQNKFSMTLNGKRNGLELEFNCRGQLKKVSHYVNNKKQGLEVKPNKKGEVENFYYIEGKEDDKCIDLGIYDELMEKYSYKKKNVKEDDYSRFLYDCWEQFLSLTKSPYVLNTFPEIDFMSEWENPFREVKCQN